MAVKLPSHAEIDYAETLLESHAADVGRVAIAWNALHDTLGELFVEIIAPDNRTTALAAWQAIQNDRSKRAMLEQAALAELGPDARFFQEIQWANGRINSLEDKRNDAVHASYTLVMDEGTIRVVPSLYTANQRARKLKDKDLKQELRSYVGHIELVREFASRLCGLARSPADAPTWPERPALPRPAQATARK